MTVIREFVEDDEVCYEYCRCLDCRLNRLEQELLDVRMKIERSDITSE